MISRRAFLHSIVATTAVGCDLGSASSPTPTLAERPLEILGRVPFLDEGQQMLDVPVGEGLDGRLYTDLSKLSESGLVIPSERFYIRTRTSDRIDYETPWKIRVRGLAREIDLTIEELTALSRPIGTTLLECSGNARGGSFGLMSAARWTGVPFEEVLAAIEGDAGAAPGGRILVAGFDEYTRPSARSVPGASWIFTRDELRETGAFLATRMNDAALPPDHGFPVRLVVPGWYGCTCIKWVDAIRFVGDDEPATVHMREFASRTHQVGEPVLARDYRRAAIELAAMPVRIERIRTEEQERLLFTGIWWGGNELEARLEILLRPIAGAQPVQLSRPRESRRTWGLWSSQIDIPAPGTYDVALRSLDRVPTRRLDTGFYTRSFSIV